MPFLFFILLVILIAQVGFWNTLGAMVGAALMMVVLVLLLVAVFLIGGLILVNRMRSTRY